MKRIRMLGISATLLSVAVTAGAQTTVFFPGVLRHQYWTSDNPNGVQHPTRVQVEAGSAGLPATDTTDLTIWDTNLNGALNYTERVSGLFIPTRTTNYVFWVNSDDDSDLFVSTDATPANKRLVAQEAGWSNVDQWHASGSGGGSTAAQKRSDQWSPDAGATHPFAKGIPMVAGQKYWIEGVHQQGGGGENFAATFSVVGEPDPVDGTKSALSVTNIGYGYTIPTSLTITTQATNATASDGREASFTFVVSDPIPDPLVYQWYRNGTAVPNATYQQYTFLTSVADNSAQYQCVVSLPGSYTNSTTATSSIVALTVVANSVFYTNGLKVERFNNFVAADAANGNTGPADSIAVSTSDLTASPLDYTGAETIINDNINNYGRRMSGWYTPKTSGNYVFFIASDDDSELFLSTDATPANKRMIAQEMIWGASREWADAGTTNTTDAGGSLLSQKRSDQWTNAVGDAPFTNGIALVAGTPYYIEADSHQGGGGDNLGVLAKLLADADPTNGAPPIPASQLSLKTTVATNLTWKAAPHNTTVFDGSQAVITGSATSDSEFAVLYQWQRSGTNIPGATGSSYSLTPTLADNGSQFSLIAATAEGGLSLQSTNITLTVQTAVFEPGLALMQYWLNKGADLTVPESGAFGPPDFTMAVPAFEAGLNNENGNTYVNSVSGFVVPQTTGAYDFYISSDDHADLWLSTDSNPNNVRLIAQNPGWANALAWDDNPGNNNASDQNQMASGTYTNAAGVAQNPNGIQLTAGTKYYMIAWHQESGGGDNVAVTFAPHQAGFASRPADGTDSALTGAVIGFNAPPTATFVAFTNQPTSQTALSGTTASFTAGGESDGKIPIGTTGLFNNSGDVAGVAKFLTFPNVLFQWYKNSTLIPGATTSTYTTPTLHPTDSAQYYVAIRALGVATWSNSTTVSLTVIDDTNKPTVYAAEFDQNLIPTVSVSFNKAMDLASISDITHYSIAGATIASVLVNSNDSRHVTLQLVAEPTSLPLSLTITGITDFSGNLPVVSILNVPGTELTNSDIGVAANNDPAFPGFMWADNTNAYTIKCEGSDIWNGDDGFNFSYEAKTGDFDVAVQQLTYTKPDNYAKGGLMVREDLTSGSRNWNIVNDPSSAGAPAVDGSGAGQNQIECNARLATSVASDTGWDNLPSRPAPAYPNAWLRLKRVGSTLTAYSGTNGQTWVQNAYTDWSTNAVPMPATVYIGICCTSHANDAATADPPLYYYTASFANYNSSYVASTAPSQSTLSASISGGNIVISWAPTGGTLQSTTALGAGAIWSTVGTANPATVPVSGAGAKFFRVVSP